MNSRQVRATIAAHFKELHVRNQDAWVLPVDPPMRHSRRRALRPFVGTGGRFLPFLVVTPANKLPVHTVNFRIVAQPLIDLSFGPRFARPIVGGITISQTHLNFKEEKRR